MLKAGSARAEHLTLFARALHELHRLPGTFGAPFTLDDHLAVRCAGLVGPLQAAFPALARPIERILAAARRAETGELAPACTVAHGDYHPGQVHLEGERVWLVDLDPLHQGNPGYDVAMALFSLMRLESTPAETRRIAPLRAAFSATWFEHADPRRAARLPLDVALIYLKRACKRFRWQDEDGWPLAVRRQIELAGRCLDLLEEARPCRTATEATQLCELLPSPGS
jgi:aminoglycoside phosphotransferase (APT) family kinase protein